MDVLINPRLAELLAYIRVMYVYVTFLSILSEKTVKTDFFVVQA